MYRAQKVLCMMIGIILTFNIIATPVFAENASQELNANLVTNKQENKTSEIPFEFNSSVNGNGSITLDLNIESTNKASSVELSIAESDSGNTVFDGQVKKGNSKFQDIEPNKVYDFTFRFIENNKEVKVKSNNVTKDSASDVIERYSGTLSVVQATDGSNNVVVEGLHRILSVKPEMIEENSKNAISTIEGSQSMMSTESNTINKSPESEEVQILSADGQIMQSSMVTTEIEPNDEYYNGQSYTEGDDMYGKIGYQGDVDYYQVTWFQSGVANFWIGMPSGKDYQMEIFNYNGTYIDGSYNGTGIDELYENLEVEVGGTYIIKVYGQKSTDYSAIEQYHLRAKSYPYPDQYDNPNNTQNNTLLTAENISDGIYYGNIHSPYDTDYYKINLSQKSVINAYLFDVPSGKNYDMYLYDSNYNMIASSTNSSNSNEEFELTVPSGTYYIRIGNDNYIDYDKDYYTLMIGHSKIWENQTSGIWEAETEHYDLQPSVFYHSTIYLSESDVPNLRQLIFETSVWDDWKSEGVGFVTSNMLAYLMALSGAPAPLAIAVDAELIGFQLLIQSMSKLDYNDAIARSTTGRLKVEVMTVVGANNIALTTTNIEPWDDNTVIEEEGYHGTFNPNGKIKDIEEHF